MMHCFRCRRCLGVGYAEEKVWHCDCGGSVEDLGPIVPGTRRRARQVAACDARCTHAIGRICDCPCRGANHGKGRVVTVEASGVAPLARSGDQEAADRMDAVTKPLWRRLTGRPRRDWTLTDHIVAGILTEIDRSRSWPKRRQLLQKIETEFGRELERAQAQYAEEVQR
ncbi:MAG: hypothetical protein IRZ06_12195 [Nevskia sp.]|nr:hypothetical protein [Nevskia sp.]